MKSRVLTIGAFAALSVLAACGSGNDGSVEHAAHTGSDHVVAEDTLPSGRVEYADNFVLLDQDGTGHELYYHQNASAIAIMIQGNGCPMSRNAWTDYKAVRDEFEAKGAKFFMLNANLQDSRDEIAAEAAEYGYDVPILKDETQLIAGSLEVTRTTEILVIDPKNWKIAYRGPVNDRLGYGRQKREASEHYVAEALTAVASGDAIEEPIRSAKGCIVNLKEENKPEEHAAISYTEVIAPILVENCVSCHQNGGIGPWAMDDFATIEGFAPMIREVVRTKRMPPWSADPEIGSFHGARDLTIEQQQDLIHWIEAGAPRGDGPDPLESYERNATDWPLGEPDLIVEASAFDVPATGVIDYQFLTAINPLEQDVWVKAITVLPGDRTVVHHALIGSSPNVTAPGEGDYDDVFENYLVGFVPGSESYNYPENTGVFVKAGGEFRFQMHYTPSGKETTDQTKVGFYFHDEEPEHILRQQVALNVEIDIPARAPAHTERAYFEFDHEAEIYLLSPHSHFRGVASKFDLEYPDGERETILSVPRYDFNWQHNYALKEPITVPAGTRLIHEMVYDNSDGNFANPDPDRDVPWGLQSADEMLYGSFFFRWSEETKENPVHDELEFRLRQYYGFADANIDGKLTRGEMEPGMRRALEAGELSAVDADEDGAISFREFYNMQLARRQQAASARDPR